MADQTIKKIIVGKGSLPPLNGDTEQYIVRYRIISEDRNRASHWSPQYYVPITAPAVESLYGVTVTKIQDSIVASWELDDDSEVLSSDIFVAFGQHHGAVGLYEYFATITGTTVTIPIPQSMSAVDVKVQLSVYPRKLVTSRIIASSGIQNL